VKRSLTRLPIRVPGCKLMYWTSCSDLLMQVWSDVLTLCNRRASIYWLLALSSRLLHRYLFAVTIVHLILEG
jgi:hypothetical protein